MSPVSYLLSTARGCVGLLGVIGLSDAYAKMQTLSEARAAHVVSLIEDLADLEAREEAEDLAAAREALADGETPVLWEDLKAELNALHGQG